MAKKTLYGVISDFHHHGRLIPAAVEVLISLGAEKIIMNGDLGNQKSGVKETQDSFARMFEYMGARGIETIVQPGGHETLDSFEPVIEYYSDKYCNIIDAKKNQLIESNGHKIVFLPGSDYLCGGDYRIIDDVNIPTGRYKEIRNDIKNESPEGCTEKKDSSTNGRAISYFNMNDLRQFVKVPDKTIAVCHIPRKFEDISVCVDTAIYGRAKEDFYFCEQYIEKGFVFLYSTAKRLMKKGYPVKIQEENRGNESLGKLFSELGIKKAINGHFHESGHRAHDSLGNTVDECCPSNELFWNCGHMDSGQAGILTVDDGKVSYKNINLYDYL